MQQLIAKIRAFYPELNFKVGQQFYWSPEKNEIIYRENGNGRQDKWSLLHETGHALLKHRSYQADYELIRMEVSAWDKAQELASKFSIVIDKNHIQDCLDTYRDWLYKRSICPNCTAKSLQQGDFIHYRCFNCHTVWKVSTNRFCRSYRATKNIASENKTSLRSI